MRSWYTFTVNIDFLENYRGKRVCVALSGGADSVCLLQIFFENADQYEIALSALTCEHGIRGEASLSDVAFVKTLCTERNVPLHIFSADIPARARASKKGLEEEGRAFRYQCFREILDRKKADVVATAHHRDDLAETVLFRLARGTSLSGIAAVKESGGIVRPLLGVSRQEILSYLNERGISFVTDETNGDERYSRNAIRKRVLPALEEIVKGAGKHIADFARRAGEDDEYLKSLAVSATRREGKNIFIPSDLPRPLFFRAAVAAIGELGGVDYGESFLREIEKLKELQSGRKVCFHGIEGVKEGDEIVFYRPEKDVAAEIPFSTGTFAFGAYRLRAEIGGCGGTLYADYDNFPADCVIRTRREGDLFTPFGGSEKPLKKYLTDRKIPARKNRLLPLVAKGSTVYAVFGVEISDLVKVTEGTECQVSFAIESSEL